MDDRPGPEPWDAVTAPDGLIARRSASLAARLDEWLADARADGSADARARERWLRTAADADATVAGVLLDLAERRAGVAIATIGGRRRRGLIEVVGADFIAVRSPPGAEVLLAMNGLASVRVASTADPATGARAVTTDLRLGDVLGELAAERPPVRLVLRDGGEVVAGELRSVGQDVVTVRTDGPTAGTAYVPIAAVVEASFG